MRLSSERSVAVDSAEMHGSRPESTCNDMSSGSGVVLNIASLFKFQRLPTVVHVAVGFKSELSTEAVRNDDQCPVRYVVTSDKSILSHQLCKRLSCGGH